jgi:transposase InsO family protein
MERRRFTREFKLEAVKLVQARDVTVAQAARDLGVHAGRTPHPRPRRRRVPADAGPPSPGAVSPNVLNRQFDAPAPNRKWVVDFTYLWTAEGWLYVAVVVDLFSRRVVGWSMEATMTAQLVTDALVMAIWRRGKPEAVIF